MTFCKIAQTLSGTETLQRVAIFPYTQSPPQRYIKSVNIAMVTHIPTYCMSPANPFNYLPTLP